MFTLICLIAAACASSFCIGLIWTKKALEKERKAVVKAELKMLDAESSYKKLQEENRKLKYLLASRKLEAGFV